MHELYSAVVLVKYSRAESMISAKDAEEKFYAEVYEPSLVLARMVSGWVLVRGWIGRFKTEA